MRKIDIIPNWIYVHIKDQGLLHIIVSAVIFKILWLIFGFVLGLIGTLCIGLFKEIYDSRSGGKFDKIDYVCDLIGILLTIILNL